MAINHSDIGLLQSIITVLKRRPLGRARGAQRARGHGGPAQALNDGRIVPTIRVYQSDWAVIMGNSDLAARNQEAERIYAALVRSHRYYEHQLERAKSVLSTIRQEQRDAMGIGGPAPAHG